MRSAIFSALLAWLACLTPRPADAQDGSPDPTFGLAGKVTTNVGANDGASALVIQPDGKIIAAGSVDNNIGLARYNSDGSLDATFDADGIVITDLGNGESVFDLVLQSDGRLVVVGASGSDLALARYNSDGSLDATFDADGFVTTDLGDLDIAYAGALQSDGKIVVAGQVTEAGVTRIALVRYNEDGSLDATFDTDGIVVTEIGDEDVALDVALQEDGKVVVVGFSATAGDVNFVVLRYNEDGSLDLTFGPGGAAITDFGGGEQAHAVAIQPDGKIVVAGFRNSGSLNFALARYDPDGSLDPAFGPGGKVVTGVGLLGASYALTLQADGKIIAAGFSDGNFAVVRYQPDGSLDPTFGVGGKAVTDFGASDTAYGLALQADGKIVAAGSNTGASINFALARYTNALPVPPACSDPTTAPSYAGGYVLNAAGSRAFVRVVVPTGATQFEFYDTYNLVISDPETDADSGTPLTGFTRSGDTFDFDAGSEPTEAYFPITTAGGGTGVSFFLRVTDTCGRTVDVDPAFAVTDAEADELTGFALAGAMPNPAATHTTIRFSLLEAGPARLAVYDVLGREVAVLVKEMLAAGAHATLFDTSALPSGLYVYRLTSGAGQRTGTLTIAR